MQDFDPRLSDERVTIVGFDSAWTDQQRKPGAICAVKLVGREVSAYFEPRLVTFSQGLSFIESIAEDAVPLIVALDQPTIVPNLSSSRPVERVAASVISWIGGGVQPSNRGRLGMFDDDAPVWKFIESLKAEHHPEDARAAKSGRYLIEVFPALALASLEPTFYTRLGGPRYNPERKTFKHQDWERVLAVVNSEARRLGLTEIVQWTALMKKDRVTKSDQDRLDAIICLLVGLRWRLESRDASVMVGCLDKGYMVSPVTPAVLSRLVTAATRHSVPVQ